MVQRFDVSSKTYHSNFDTDVMKDTRNTFILCFKKRPYKEVPWIMNHVILIFKLFRKKNRQTKHLWLKNK